MKKEDSNINVLLVEDDKSLGILLVDFLVDNNIKVDLFQDGDVGLNAFRINHYNMCILDVMLPKMDGFMVAERIRAENKQIPIIFLTARSLKEEKIKGFSLGVDDYITKPFDEDELLCRINAVMNRFNKAAGIEILNIFKIGDFEFDYVNQELRSFELVKRLTKKESEVLRMLCLEKNKRVKREDLLKSLWGSNDYFSGRSLDVFIAKIRKYLKSDTNVKLQNIPTVGYILRDL